uniref:Uncharacterized protein n=1 Tax=Helianthus annuus TaxID=4232 RepID=A0A251SNW8_HELAN
MSLFSRDHQPSTNRQHTNVLSSVHQEPRISLCIPWQLYHSLIRFDPITMVHGLASCVPVCFCFWLWVLLRYTIYFVIHMSLDAWLQKSLGASYSVDRGVESTRPRRRVHGEYSDMPNYKEIRFRKLNICQIK